MRVALVFLAALAWVSGAAAAPPAVLATASATVGVAPFAVTLSASGDAVAYSWDFGDGARGEGASVRHVYPAGRFVAVVTATSAMVRLRTPGPYHARYGAARSTERAVTVRPKPVTSLGIGSRGPSVLALERRLAELRFALRGADSTYATDTFEAVLAFQKVHGLTRTGRVDASLWGRLATATVPRTRYPSDTRIEVDKTRQLLFEIECGEVKRVVHVSTGATGNTPLGTWHVYRKVTGFDWVLWYPMYFLRGFAIHGYPSVPAYPASHGCARVPMWIAPVLFARHAYGATITVYA